MDTSRTTGGDKAEAALKRLGWAVLLLTLLCGLGYFVLRLGVTLIFMLGTAASSKDLSPADVGRDVSAELRDWRGFPNSNGTYAPPPDFPIPTESQINGIHGYSESSGMHGDGDDWYEFRLGAGVSEQLLRQLPQADEIPISVKRPGSGLGSPPAWWPAAWPTGTRFFRQQWGELAIEPDGTRGWYHRIRS